MMVAEPLDRPPAPDAGDDFEVKIRVALQTPDDCRDALLLSREECIDEIPATLLRQMIEVTIVKAPRAAPSGIDPFGSVGHHLSCRNPANRPAHAGHDSSSVRDTIPPPLTLQPSR